MARRSIGLGVAAAWCIAGASSASFLGCDGKPAPSPVVAASAPRAASSAESTNTPPPSSSSSMTSSATPSGSVATPPPAASVDPLATPALTGEDGKPLPQTKDKPANDSPAFQARMNLLWRAMVEDDPKIAEAVFFPAVAYEQVKDIDKPRSDWTHRLMKAFARNIREYHKDLGPEPKALTFVGAEIDPARVKWMEPGKEGNKVGYYRVTRSKLVYKDPSGAEKKLELTSLISWRGEWFVVHLHGFK